MRLIELDATNWKTIVDFYDALLPAIGAPKWHGKSPDALIDSMIWGGINSVEPPYMVKISGAGTLPENILDRIKLIKQVLAEGRIDYQMRRGGDIDVTIEIEP